MEVKYINTDLEIESKSDLSKIVEEFGEDVLVLHHGEIRGYQHASFEIAGGSADADASLNLFCALVEGLPRGIREIWDGCVSRVFDMGYESGTSSHTCQSAIKGSTIQRVAKIDASFVITIYPGRADSASGSARQ